MLTRRGINWIFHGGTSARALGVVLFFAFALTVSAQCDVSASTIDTFVQTYRNPISSISIQNEFVRPFFPHLFFFFFSFALFS
jgi:hypothetical protein